MKNQDYIVYSIFQEDKSEYLFKHFEKNFEAREFVKKQLEEDLKVFYYQTNNEFFMLEKYFGYRKYSYKILNDDFDCDTYIRQIAPKVYNFLEQNSINKGFKLNKQKEEKVFFEDIENCKIVQISKTEDFFEIAYEKNQEIKYLTIEQRYSISSGRI